MIGYKDTLNLLSKAIGALFKKEISYFDTDDLNSALVFIDDCIKKIKDHQTKTMMKDITEGKTLKGFYTLFIIEADQIKYIVEIGSVMNEQTFQYIISKQSHNDIVVRRKQIRRGLTGYRSDFNENNMIVCLTRLYKPD